MTTSVLLLRHAKRSSASDRDPPISDEGRKAQKNLAALLKDEPIPPPSSVLYSPTQRTKESAEIIADSFSLQAKVEPLLFFSQDEMQLFQKIPDPLLNQTIVFVGHAPSLAFFAAVALGKTPDQGALLQESSALILQFENRIAPGQARFVKYIISI
jgi:phosphohistidine phosphatase SixA